MRSLTRKVLIAALVAAIPLLVYSASPQQNLANFASYLVANSSGNVTLGPPTSGTALTVTGVSGSLGITATQPVGHPGFTVATLPTCNATLKGGMAYVTDATAPTYNAALTGGSNVIVPVFCNGTAWSSH